MRVFDDPVGAWTMHVGTTVHCRMALNNEVAVDHDDPLRHLHVCLAVLLHCSPSSHSYLAYVPRYHHDDLAMVVSFVCVDDNR